MRGNALRASIACMSQAIIQSMLDHEPNAFSKAKKWMTYCRHNTPEAWTTYSKLMATYLEELDHYTLDSAAGENAWPIVRYYTLALDKLQNSPWHPHSFLLLHNTFDLWEKIPANVWLALHQQQWSPTTLYQWSLDNKNIQQTTLNTRTPGKFHAEPLHIRMGTGILEQYFKGLPLLLDSSVHWNLWDVFYGEQVYQASPDLAKRIDLMASATPGCFEHAITEFYQLAPEMWTQTSCTSILNMDMTQGDRLTTCSGVLLLYSRFQARGRKAFASIEKRYPLLLAGFDFHLTLYPDINDALFHAPALMGHWMRSVHGSASEDSICLPENLDASN